MYPPSQDSPASVLGTLAHLACPPGRRGGLQRRAASVACAQVERGLASNLLVSRTLSACAVAGVAVAIAFPQT